MAQQVLILEDSPDARVLYSQALRAEDYKTVEFETASLALAYLKQVENLPDVLLVDLTLPDMDGADFIEALRSDSRLTELKIIIVSGWDDIRSRSESLKTAGYLRKPFELDRLYNLLDEVLQS